MSKTLFTSGKLRFEQVRGVGTIETDFLPNKRVYTLIGENGVGKTKFLECLFTLLFLVNEEILIQILFFPKYNLFCVVAFLHQIGILYQYIHNQQFDT